MVFLKLWEERGGREENVEHTICRQENIEKLCELKMYTVGRYIVTCLLVIRL